jgi:inorganic pyrophosphatase/exopolyphosphatase
MGKIYVIGLNQDMDAIASAMDFAWLLDNQNNDEVVPARVGPINL